MRRAGIPGRLIAAIAAFDYESAVSIKIAPNRYTRPIPVTRGMLEGGSGSPGKFTIQCAGLARAVRDLGCGVPSPAGIISGLLHMDDLGQVVCGEADGVGLDLGVDAGKATNNIPQSSAADF